MTYLFAIIIKVFERVIRKQIVTVLIVAPQKMASG